ncbi:acyl-CoA dehydrogenase family protein [Streptomyces sp. NPDC046332]|uniref:acyl-CoA dehydrogenase family protein n=1 Tax=unclassified Streptomyces TaxID=2593676 RepID=UPI0033CAF9E5
MSGLTPEVVEELLGDPTDPENPYGFAAAVARDEEDAAPDDLCRKLVSAGFHLNYLPEAWGGEFRSFDRSLTLVRAAARRDVNVMPGTMFGIIAATCLQLHGNEEQRSRAAEILTSGGTVAFALTEAEHGSDILANEVRLAPDGTLHGEKWMVGNGLGCDAVYVVARTGERGPGAFTAFLLDLDPERGGEGTGLERLPAARTNGMRGIDTARLRFTGLPVPESAQVGRVGEGLEMAVRAQQAVRVMSMAGSLGCVDTAVRLTLDFAAGHRVGGTPVLRTPYARRELAATSAALIAADATALAAARGVHAVPGAFSVWALAAKHVVAETADALLRRCARLLATRSVLREGPPGSGLFQKLQRDSAVIRVIDSGPMANLRSYAGQLPGLLDGTRTAPAGLLDGAFRLDEEPPPYDPTGLDLVVRGADPVLAELPASVREFTGTREAAADPFTGSCVARLAAAVDALPALAAAARVRGADPNALVDLAERHAWLHGAAACLHLWRHNRYLSLYGTPPGSTGWLGAALAHLLAQADGAGVLRHAEGLYPALDAVEGLWEGNRMLTALPVRLAPTTAHPTPMEDD